MRKYSDPKKTIKSRPFLRYILCICVIVLSVVQMFVLNSLSTKGSLLTETELEITKKQDENEILEAKVASSSSMTMVFARAKRLGLVETPETVSLKNLQQVAQIEKIFN